jgi:hypothetical protein
MTTERVTLKHRSTRLLWLWCVAYTAITPHDSRGRRRAELRSHLWESEHAGLPPRALLFAAVRGWYDDVTWAVQRGAFGLWRSLATPTPYVVLALAFPVQAWIVSSASNGHPARISERLGGVGGPALLLVAAVVWGLRRRRS